MRWVLRLIATGEDDRCPSADLMEICRPEGLVDIANLGLTLPEAKQVLASVQRAVVSGQVDSHGPRRPCCRPCAGKCHLKDWRGQPHRDAVRQSDGAASPVSVPCLQPHRDGRMLAIAVPIEAATPSRGALSSPRGVAIAREMGGAVASDLTIRQRRRPTGSRACWRSVAGVRHGRCWPRRRRSVC